MAKRWGPGPVFVYESLVAARRWQIYASRAGFVLVLLAGIVTVWASQTATSTMSRSNQLAKLGEGFFYALTGLQLSLILLAAPAAAAGSVCVDRERGTLLHMMVTDLTDGEIVLGKLGSRLAPVFGLVACGLPVAALAGLLGGVDFGALAGSFAVTLALAVLGCSLALTLSVRVRKMHEVLMAVYAAEGIWLLALPIWQVTARNNTNIIGPPDWFAHLNPIVLAFAPYVWPQTTGWDTVAIFVVASLAASALLLVASIFSLRREAIEGPARPEKGRRRLRLEIHFPSMGGPSLDGNPVLWREWHRNRPSKLARRLWGGILLVTWGLVFWGVWWAITEGAATQGSPMAFGMVLQVLFGLLLVAATAPTALAEERMRGSLDILLSTPMTTRSIVLAKWWGAYRKVLVLALLPLFAGAFLAATMPSLPLYAGSMTRFATPAIPLGTGDRVAAAACSLGDFLASGAAIVSVGLALATWVPRLGRAVAASVIVHFLVSIGWIFVTQLAFSLMGRNVGNSWNNQNRWLKEGFSALSPLYGAIAPIEHLYGLAFQPRWPLWTALAVAIWAKATFAAGLLWLTIRQFDRCLGRVPEVRPSRHAAAQARIEKAEAEAEVAAAYLD